MDGERYLPPHSCLVLMQVETGEYVEEAWKDIVGYEGKYQVSNLGRVKSFKHRKPHIMVGSVSHDGYQLVLLSSGGKNIGKSVHRLVAQAFLSNPNNYPVVNHKDGNKLNNIVDNLEWCTYSENILHSMYVLNDNVNCTKIKCLETGEIFPSVSVAARKTGRDRKSITQAADHLRGNKGACGLHWEWLNKDPNPSRHKIKKYESNGRQKVQPKYRIKVRCLETKEIYNSLGEAARANNIHECSISRAIQNPKWTAGGYHWFALDKISLD